MLKHRDAYENTKKMVRERRAGSAEFVKSHPEIEFSDEESGDMLKIEASIKEFEDICNGKANLTPLDELNQWENLLIKWRLAKHWSVEELAEEAGIHLAELLLYESYDYEDCPYKVMREIKDILKYRTPKNPENELDGPWEPPMNKNQSDEPTSTPSEG